MAQASDATTLTGAPISAPRRTTVTKHVTRFIREKPLGAFGALIVLILLFLALFGQWLGTSDPNQLGTIDQRLQSPSLAHPLGTDQLGRDVLNRVAVHGARVSMVISLLAVITATIISVSIGVTSGYFGGKVDLLLQRLVDAFIAFPALVFLLAVVAIFRDSDIPGAPTEGLFQSQNIVLFLTIGTLLGVGSSRVIRGATLSVREMAFVQSARAVGAGHLRMILVHIIPNVAAPVITLASLGLGTAVLVEASLSFLGLGVSPDIPTWGGMLNREGRQDMVRAPWLALAPGIALSLVVFGFNMFGDALRDVLDPRLRAS